MAGHYSWHRQNRGNGGKKKTNASENDDEYVLIEPKESRCRGWHGLKIQIEILLIEHVHGNLRLWSYLPQGTYFAKIVPLATANVTHVLAVKATPGVKYIGLTYTFN